MATAALIAAVVFLAIAITRMQARIDGVTTQTGVAALVTRQLSDLAERIGRLDEATRHVERVGDSIVELEQLLAAPKLRGEFGETALETLLAEVLPSDQWARQHRLDSRGVIADAVVRTGDGRWLAIDSKFPIDAYQRVMDAEQRGSDETARRGEFIRSVRARIDEIARKYISPDDDGLDFALMFIPAESVYYEIAVRDRDYGLAQYARDRHVLLCSPNTLYAYLQALMIGIRGAHIAREVKGVLGMLEHLRQDLGQAQDSFARATTQLRYAASNLEEARGALTRVEERVDRAAAPATESIGLVAN